MRLNTGAIHALDELREHARICKNRHFAAGNRKLKCHVFCGVPVMLMTFLTGTALLHFLFGESHPEWATMIAIILAFVSSALSGLQTFFNFHKSAEGHRSVANRYQEIARRCRHFIQQQSDMDLCPEEVWNKVDELRREYAKVNEDAEAFSTNNSDLKKALANVSVTPFSAAKYLPDESNSLEKDNNMTPPENLVRVKETITEN